MTPLSSTSASLAPAIFQVNGPFAMVTFRVPVGLTAEVVAQVNAEVVAQVKAHDETGKGITKGSKGLRQPDINPTNSLQRKTTKERLLSTRLNTPGANDKRQSDSRQQRE